MSQMYPVNCQANPPLTPLFKKRLKGQALIEFTLALPILLLILLAAYMVGAAMYTGANASTAVRNAISEKYDYADSDQALNDLRENINGYDLGTFEIIGDNVDSLTLSFTNNETPVIVAKKSIKFPLFPTFNYIETAGIGGNLMRNNTDPFTLDSALPYNQAIPPQYNLNPPATFGFDPLLFPPYIPFAAGQEDLCTPDTTIFTDPVQGGLYVTAYQANVLTPQGACQAGSFKTNTNDVTFNGTPPNY